MRYLAPLKKLLEKLSQLDDFQALPEVFKPLMHTLLLIWKHSQFYNTAARMACMLSEICDELIAQASRFLPGWYQILSSTFCHRSGRCSTHTWHA